MIILATYHIKKSFLNIIAATNDVIADDFYIKKIKYYDVLKKLLQFLKIEKLTNGSDNLSYREIFGFMCACNLNKNT